MSPRIESGTILAIMQPTMPCATAKIGTGNCTLPPAEAKAMPAISGPSISAAGACSHRSSAVTGSVIAISAGHCVTWLSLLNKLLRLALHRPDRRDQLGDGRDETCIIRATQHQRDRGLAVAEGGIGADVEILVALLQATQRFGDDAL